MLKADQKKGKCLQKQKKKKQDEKVKIGIMKFIVEGDEGWRELLSLGCI